MRPSIVSISASFFTLTRKRYVPLVVHAAFRQASRQSASRFKETSTQLPIGNNGSILVNILQPVSKSGAKKKGSKNVVLYLPPGPLFASPTTSDQIGPVKSLQDDELDPPLTPERALASATLATVVTVNYRLDRDAKDEANELAHKYPTPVHDTLAGFDWILKNLQPSQICVFGTHIGGSLAVMLALTESRSVRAIAAKEPMCDWVGLDDYCQIAPENSDVRQESNGQDTNESDPTLVTDTSTTTATQSHRRRGRRRKQAPADLVPLLESRSILFRKPENYFDAFASPALFLRSSGKECPKSFPTYLTGPEYPVPVLQRPASSKKDDEWYTNLFTADPDVDVLPEHVDSPSSSEAGNTRRRRVLARWPPHGLDYGLDSYGAQPDTASSDPLALPDVRIFVNSNINHNDVTDANTTMEGQLVAQSKRADQPAEPLTESTEGETDGPKEEETAKSRRAQRGSLADVVKSTTGETVLARQGAEMVSLMHNACFWGHPAGFGEERVRIVRVPYSPEQSGDDGAVPASSVVDGGKEDATMSMERAAGKWFHHVFEEGGDSKSQ